LTNPVWAGARAARKLGTARAAARAVGRARAPARGIRSLWALIHEAAPLPTVPHTRPPTVPRRARAPARPRCAQDRRAVGASPHAQADMGAGALRAAAVGPARLGKMRRCSLGPPQEEAGAPQAGMPSG
jgi:hypothetical protein